MIFAVRFLNFFLCTLNVESLCNNVYWLHVIAFVLTAPFGLISNIGFFVSSTVLSTMIIITAGLTISSYFIYYSALNGTSTSANMIKLENLGEFFGVVCYAIEGMGLLFPIRASVTDREFFKSIYGSVYGIVVSFYFLLGITGTLAYGSEVSKTEVVLLNFGPDMILIYPQSLLYSIGIFISIPYILFPVSVSISQMEFCKEFFEVKYFQKINFLGEQCLLERCRSKNIIPYFLLPNKRHIDFSE